MKNKVQIHQFNPEIYPLKLWIVVTNNLKIIESNFLDYESEGTMTFDERTIKGAAFTHYVISKEERFHGALIVFHDKSCMTIKNIAHEAAHAARRMWENLGEINVAEEANAYLVGWIADCCAKIKNNIAST